MPLQRLQASGMRAVRWRSAISMLDMECPPPTAPTYLEASCSRFPFWLAACRRSALILVENFDKCETHHPTALLHFGSTHKVALPLSTAHYFFDYYADLRIQPLLPTLARHRSLGTFKITAQQSNQQHLYVSLVAYTVDTPLNLLNDCCPMRTRIDEGANSA